MPASNRVSRALRCAAASVAVGALAVSLAACSVNDDLASDYREGSNKGYISVGFSVADIPEAERGAPVAFAGVTEDADAVSDADFAGQVVVVNFWYAACGPCIAEAPVLEEVWQEYAGEGVQFLGVNIYDQAPTAQSFARDNGVTYPSVIDITDKQVSLAFAAETPLQAPPTTLVLDREGRVAARVIGQIKDASILSTLVRETLAESS
jgi:Thiol-disulfide isomerase and thioredoxins